MRQADVTIRQMRAEDASAVANLTTQLGYPSREADVATRYQLLERRPDARLLVAENGAGAIVGWIHMQIFHSLESDARAEIWGLIVSDSARGHGIGRRLVEAGEQWAQSAGMTMIGVRSNTLRVDAHGFYEHLGYQLIKTQKAFRKQL